MPREGVVPAVCIVTLNHVISIFIFSKLHFQVRPFALLILEICIAIAIAIHAHLYRQAATIVALPRKQKVVASLVIEVIHIERVTLAILALGQIVTPDNSAAYNTLPRLGATV